MKIIQKFILLSILVSFALSCSKNDKNSILYDKIHPKKSLNQELSSIDFKNKFTIVDFWATWCAPCIKGFDHLNELANDSNLKKKYNFIIISDEEEKKIKRRLADKNYDFVSLVDSLDQQKNNCGFKGKTFKEFNICALPTAVILNTEGNEVWRGQTKELTVDKLNQLYGGKKEVKNTSKTDSRTTSKVPKIDTIQTADYVFLSAESEEESNRSSTAADFSRFAVKGHSTKDLLVKITNENDYKFNISDNLANRFFTLKYDSQADEKSEKDHRAIVFQLFLDNFGLVSDTIQKQIKYKEVNISDLKLIEEAKSIESEDSYHSGYDYDTNDEGGKIVIINSKLETLVKILNDYFDTAYILSQDIEDITRYDFVIPYDKQSEILEVLNNTYGLSFESKEMMTMVLNISSLKND